MRYLLFGGDAFYAKGGGWDFLEASDSLERLLKQPAKYDDDELDWWHIFDTKVAKVVQGSFYQAHDAPEDMFGEDI